MRQIGIAIFGYAADQKDFIVPGGYAFDNSDMIAFDDILDTYLADQLTTTQRRSRNHGIKLPLFQCPLDDVPRQNNWNRRSYSMAEGSRAFEAEQRSVNAVAGVTRVSNAGAFSNLKFKIIPLLDVPAPSQTLFMVEHPYRTNTIGWAFWTSSTTSAPTYQGSLPTDIPRLVPLHSGSWNYLFADGHVAMLKPQDTIRPPFTMADNGNGFPTYMWTRDPND